MEDQLTRYELTDCHRQRIRETIHALQVMEAKFDMDVWFDHAECNLLDGLRATTELLHDCGTSCCIGGTVNALFFPGQASLGCDLVGAALGLDYEGSRDLFYPHGCSSARGGCGYLSCKNPRAAAVVLQHLHDHGVVDWSVADDYFRAHPEEKF